MSAQRTLTIEQVLPHQGRMRLLDELLEYAPGRVVCGVSIRPDSLFYVEAHGVPSWVGLEYMAQTACAYSGIEEVQRGLKPSIALLLGARRYQARTPAFELGARLRIVAELALRDENDLVAFDCAIHQGDVTLARADLKAIRPKSLEAIVSMEPRRSE